MWKYYLLKLKSIFRILPYILIAVAVLFSCLCIAFNTAIQASRSNNKMRFRLALVCTEDDPYFKAGLEIAQAYDSSRFSIETHQMEESEAREALQKGNLDAYVVIPQGYIQAAMNGELGSLKYVSTTGTAELTTLFKDEVTGVVADIIITCEKAMYGIEHIAADYDFEDREAAYVQNISLKYVDYILERSDLYYVQELGIHDSLGLDGYLFAGITVIVFSVMLLPASVCYIQQDDSVLRLLKSKNIGAGMQVAGEFGAFFTLLLIPALLLFGASYFVGDHVSPELSRLIHMFSGSNAFQIIAVVLTLCAFGYFLYQLADELVGGIVLYFFVTLGLSFISGCIYPLYFFPDTVRRISQFTPHGLCRSVLSGCIIGQHSNVQLLLLFTQSAVLLFAAYLVRVIRLRGAKR